MPTPRPRAVPLLLALAAAARLALMLAAPGSVADAVARRIEVSTPTTAHARLREGVHLYARGLSPYEGSVFYQPPLLLPVFAALPGLLHTALFVLADYGTAKSVARLARAYAGDTSEWISVFYLLNPLSILTCASMSSVVLTNYFVVKALDFASRGKTTAAALQVAVAAYLSYYPLYLIVPVTLILREKDAGAVAKSVFAFTAGLAALLGASFFVAGYSWAFLSSVYGTIFLVPDLTPTIGLYWYFFIEMFEFFRPFFLFVFQVCCFIFVVPVSIKFRERPYYAAVVIVGIISLFKSYPSYGDYMLFFALVLTLNKELLKSELLFKIYLLHTVLLGVLPPFYNIWVKSGTGNANFFYATTLFANLTLAFTVLHVAREMKVSLTRLDKKYEWLDN